MIDGTLEERQVVEIFRARVAEGYCVSTPRCIDRYYRGLMLHSALGCERCKSGFWVCEMERHFCTQKAARTCIDDFMRAESGTRRWEYGGFIIRQISIASFYARGEHFETLAAARDACAAHVAQRA